MTSSVSKLRLTLNRINLHTQEVNASLGHLMFCTNHIPHIVLIQAFTVVQHIGDTHNVTDPVLTIKIPNLQRGGGVATYSAVFTAALLSFPLFSPLSHYRCVRRR